MSEVPTWTCAQRYPCYPVACDAQPFFRGLCDVAPFWNQTFVHPLLSPVWDWMDGPHVLVHNRDDTVHWWGYNPYDEFAFPNIVLRAVLNPGPSPDPAIRPSGLQVTVRTIAPWGPAIYKNTFWSPQPLGNIPRNSNNSWGYSDWKPLYVPPPQAFPPDGTLLANALQCWPGWYPGMPPT